MKRSAARYLCIVLSALVADPFNGSELSTRWPLYVSGGNPCIPKGVSLEMAPILCI